MALRPVIAGIGFRAGATPESLSSAYAAAGGGADALATAADKAGAPALLRFAADLGLAIIPLDAAALAAQPTPTRSAASLAARGTGSLAEAAALAAAGPGARLIAPRAVSADRMATCALASGETE